jgi:hypothetical protein
MQLENEPSNLKEETTTKPHFIDDEKFLQLRQCQQAIFTATEVSPSIRKLVNALITEENLQAIKTQYLRKFNV